MNMDEAKEHLYDLSMDPGASLSVDTPDAAGTVLAYLNALEQRAQAVRDAWARVDDTRPPDGFGDLFEALEAL